MGTLKKTGWLFLLLFILLSPCIASAESFSGKCISVPDGDKITVLRDGKEITVRIFAVDCPERAQDFGYEAWELTSALVLGKEVSLEVKEIDHHRRYVCRVTIDGKDLSLELINAGLAWYDEGYYTDRDLKLAEEKARTHKVGLWASSNPDPPWEFRRRPYKEARVSTSADSVGPRTTGAETGENAGASGILFDDAIEVSGQQIFTDQVNAALTLLKEKDPGAYYIVKTYVKRIKESDRSGMAAYENPPTFYFSDKSAFYSVTWCAGDIAHDSYHSKLYHDYAAAHRERVPDEIWTGLEAEKKCIAHQLEVARKINSPENEIEHLKKCDGTHSDVNKDGKYDWDDWNQRDW